MTSPTKPWASARSTISAPEGHGEGLLCRGCAGGRSAPQGFARLGCHDRGPACHSQSASRQSGSPAPPPSEARRDRPRRGSPTRQPRNELQPCAPAIVGRRRGPQTNQGGPPPWPASALKGRPRSPSFPCCAIRETPHLCQLRSQEGCRVLGAADGRCPPRIRRPGPRRPESRRRSAQSRRNGWLGSQSSVLRPATPDDTRKAHRKVIPYHSGCPRSPGVGLEQDRKIG